MKRERKQRNLPPPRPGRVDVADQMDFCVDVAAKPQAWGLRNNEHKLL